MSPLNRREMLKRGTAGVLAAVMLGRAIPATAKESNPVPVVALDAPTRRKIAYVIRGFGAFDARPSGTIDGQWFQNCKLNVFVYSDGSAKLRIFDIMSEDEAMVTIPIAAPFGRLWLDKGFTMDAASSIS